MAYTRSFESYRPPRRYDDLPYTSAEIRECLTEDGTYVTIDTQVLDPVDSDPENPIYRNFTTDDAVQASAWYVIRWVDDATAVFDSDPVYFSPDGSLTGTSEYNFARLQSAMDDLAGIDLDDVQRDELLNQAHRELAVRSEWYRAEIELGPALTDQEAYTLPDDVHRILSLRVEGESYKPSYEEQVDRVRLGQDSLLVAGLYWQSWGANNQRQISIYPTLTSGTSITCRVVERPPLMVNDDDVPVVPEEYRQAIVDKASAIYFGSVEDNPDLRAFYEEQFDRKVAELRRLVFTTGRDVGFWGAA